MNYQPSIFDGTEQSMLNKSLELIKGFESVALQRNPLGYIVGYSGGKDSDVLVNLFIRSGVKFCVIHNHTTLDAPETVYYVRRKFAEWQAGGGYLAEYITHAKTSGNYVLTQECCRHA